MMVPYFNLKFIEHQLKKRKKRSTSELEYLESLAFVTGNEDLQDKVGEYLDYIGDRKPKKWNLPFRVETSGIWEMYSWNFHRPSIPKKKVLSEYHSWLRLNYEMAAYNRNFSCLLRSPTFWKTLYVQNLVNMSPQISRWAIQAREDERKNQIAEEDVCGGTPLYTLGTIPMLPQPLWVIYRFMYGGTKFIDKILKQSDWLQSGAMSSTKLLSIDPMLKNVWKNDYKNELNQLQAEFVRLKFRNPAVMGNYSYGSFNESGFYELETTFTIPMPIPRTFSLKDVPVPIDNFAGVQNIENLQTSFSLGPESVFSVSFNAVPGQTIKSSLVEDSIRQILLHIRSKLALKQVLDIILSNQWDMK